MIAARDQLRLYVDFLVTVCHHDELRVLPSLVMITCSCQCGWSARKCCATSISRAV